VNEVTNARIRGIYSTALTKLLLDQGFEIVQASTTLKDRFELEGNMESPDIDIYDRYGRQGVRVLGKAEAVKSFKSILQAHFDDVIIREWKATADGIYKGLKKHLDTEAHLVLVDIGPAIGKVDEEEIRDSDMQSVVVQVERRRIGAKEPILTTEIKIPGKYAILIRGHQVKVSRKILDWQKRSHLIQLGKDLNLRDWGVIWRTSAADQLTEVLRNEIVNLLKEGGGVLKKAEQTEAPAVLWEGSHFVEIEFPALSKRKFDEIRGVVTPTLDGHHFYKTCGKGVSSAVDMAEKLLAEGKSTEEVEALFQKTIQKEFPEVGSTIDIEHVKLDGRIFHLGEALIESFDNENSVVKFSRVFRREGVYDGLKTLKETGDIAITEAKIGEWHFKTQYFSKDGKSKGTYVNFNTPIELYPYSIRYVDLEIDVCVWPDGKIEILDEEKFENAVREGLVPKKLSEIVRERLQEILKDLSSKQA
jgi:Ribonuclease G/E